jgi:mxaD protein
MPSVTESVRIPMYSEFLWPRIGAFGSVDDWHPMLRRVESEGDHIGARRFVETKEGERMEERLSLYDSETHCYYYMMESTPLPVRDYKAEFEIIDEDLAVSRVLWSTYFEVTSEYEAATIDTVRGFLRAGLDNLQKLYGAAE